MEDLEVVFVSLTGAVTVCVALLAFFKINKEENLDEEIRVKMMVSDIINEPKPEVVKPKRRYKKRKKKTAVAPIVETPKKVIGRPKKQQ